MTRFQRLNHHFGTAVFMIFLLATNSARAADWMLLRRESYGDSYIDLSSIAVSGFIRHATIKLTHPPPRQTSNLPWIQYGILLVAFDCKEHRQQINAMTFFFSDGKVEKEPVNDQVLWDPIRPDMASASDLDFVCGWGGK